MKITQRIDGLLVLCLQRRGTRDRAIAAVLRVQRRRFTAALTLQLAYKCFVARRMLHLLQLESRCLKCCISIQCAVSDRCRRHSIGCYTDLCVCSCDGECSGDATVPESKHHPCELTTVLLLS